MSRPARLTLIALGAFLFLAVSGLLARGLSGTGQERSAILGLLRAQARGDARAVLASLPDCRTEPACVTTTRARVVRLRRPGAVQLLNFQPSVGLSLTRQPGTARVAWRAGTALPVVQCVRVVRDGPLTGGGVRLRSLSDPVGGESPCPR